MDKDGYPDEKELDTIRKWGACDGRGLLEYVRGLWAYQNYFRPGRIYWRVSTAGWSGNESLIGAMQDNFVWWSINWVSTTRGGHYVFQPKQIK
jgi:hypothetical protein